MEQETIASTLTSNPITGGVNDFKSLLEKWLGDLNTQGVTNPQQQADYVLQACREIGAFQTRFTGYVNQYYHENPGVVSGQSSSHI